ncbi:MAG: alkaline phosphatase family protein [Candidatus Sulfotelmatobacter sp.]
MSRSVWVSVSLLLLGVAAFLLSMNGCGGGNTTAVITSTPPASKIQHVVIIFQENRTPDNLFQDPALIANGADIQNYGVNSKGTKIPLSQIDLGTAGSNPDDYDLSHAHSAFVDMCDLNTSTNTCAMDGADLIPIACQKGAANCPPANPQFMYVNPADVQPYFTMAEQYTFADRMFQTNQGPSFPAHQFIISGTSAPTATSNLFAAENPIGGGSIAGCIAPPAETVALIDPTGAESSTMYPCFEHATLTDLLDTANVSWRYYAPSAGSIWTAPNAIQHMCGPNVPPPNGTACVGPDWAGSTPKVVLNQTESNAQILTDIASGQLAQVSWVIPQGKDSDHASSNNGCGPSWVTLLVNALGNSQYWSNTAIILTWDDWGGWYDHVPPAVISNGSSWGSGYLYGFRVPMIVISPYAKTAYISHVTHDFGSVLKFIETTFNLPSLGYADAPADNLSDIFNFSQTPTAFQTIAAPPDDAACRSDTTPATDPDDD